MPMTKYVLVFLFVGSLSLGLVKLAIVPSYPLPDEIYQLQAAINITNGAGMTISFDDMRSIRDLSNCDLSKITRTTMTNWPPLYTLLLASIIYLGGSAQLAMRILVFILSVGGIVGWYMLIRVNVRSAILQWTAVAVYGLQFLSMQTSVLATGAIFPYIIILIQKISSNRENGKTLIWLGLAAVLSIMLRYQMLVFIVVLPLIVLLLPVKKKVLFSFMLTLGVALPYFGLRFLYSQYSTNSITQIQPQLALSFIALCKSLYTLIPKVFFWLDLKDVINVHTHFFIIVLNTIAILILSALYKKSKPLILTYILMFLTSFILLSITQSALGFDAINTMRYWWYLRLTSLLLVLMFIDSRFETIIDIFDSKPLGRVISLIPIIFVVGVSVKAVDKAYKNGRIQTEKYRKLEEQITVSTRIDKNSQKTIFFFDKYNSGDLFYVLAIKMQQSVLRELSALKNPNLYVSGEEQIFLIIDKDSSIDDLLSETIDYCHVAHIEMYDVFRLNVPGSPLALTQRI